MAWQFTDENAGWQGIQVQSDVPKHRPGTRVRAYDDSGAQGEGEFVYLQGLASGLEGSAVIFDNGVGNSAMSTTLTRGMIAFLMTPLTPGLWGWAQIWGKAIVKATTVTPGNVYATATGGQLDDTVVAGAMVVGATWKSSTDTPKPGTAYAQVTYPTMTGLG